ncbi:MAG: dicarboxylate/amino acid:cation symporter [Fimbriimonadaceae bacterium]
MQAERRGLPLHTKIFIGLIIGVIAGTIAQFWLGAEDQGLNAFVKNVTHPAGQLFLRLIFMIVVPLLFSALVLGVAEIGDVRKIGRVGLRALGMTVILSGIAVLLGLFMVNTFRPGDGIDAATRTKLTEVYAKKSSKDIEKNVKTAEENRSKTVGDKILEVVPKNPLEEAVRALEGGLLPFMFFALIFGIALAMIEPERAMPVKAFLDGIFAVSLKIIDFAMAIAPIGVAALMFGTVALLGVGAIAALAKYVVIVLVALAFHQFVVYSLVLKFIAKRSPLQFFRQMRRTMMTAFATSSSNATLPVALDAATTEVGLPKNISSFVLTVGATANQNGTALFEGITILFLAQFFGVNLDFGQQLTVMGLAIVAGIGTAGVPGGAWPMIAIILIGFGIPGEAIGICLGIDRILDMSRTVLNVTGDMTIAACVSQMEGTPQGPTAELAEA